MMMAFSIGMVLSLHVRSHYVRSAKRFFDPGQFSVRIREIPYMGDMRRVSEVRETDGGLSLGARRNAGNDQLIGGVERRRIRGAKRCGAT
jgi:hypothetical protein